MGIAEPHPADALSDDLSGAQHDDAVGQRHHGLHDMLDRNDAHAAVANLEHQVDCTANVGLVDASHHFVEQQHAWLHSHDARNLEPLEPADGQSLRLGIKPRRKSHAMRGLSRHFACLAHILDSGGTHRP